MKYELIDHTADLGIHVFGNDARSLFDHAAFALFDLLTDIRKLKATEKQLVRITGDDWPDLMVNWLRELLYLWAGEGRLVKMAEIHSISEQALSSTITVDRYDPNRHLIKNEIKAVTYHQIQVKSDQKGWESTIIFDA